MMRRILLLMLSLVIVACASQPVSTPAPVQSPTEPPAVMPTTFNGVPLPQERPVRDKPAQYLPAAWLIAGGEAVVPTYGSYTISYEDETIPRSKTGEVVMIVEHADAILPSEDTGVVTATLPPDQRAVIVIGSTAVRTFEASVADWPDVYGPSARTLPAERQSAGNLTAFTLEPTANAGDLLLTVSIRFDGGDATYFWRLNPAPAGDQAASLEPAVSAAMLRFLSWSPDGETVAYLAHTPEDLAILPPFPPGALNFLNARTGRVCDSALVFPEGDYDRAGQLAWLPDGRLQVELNGQRWQGTPCAGEFSLAPAAGAEAPAAVDPALSPGGGHRAATEILANKGGFLSLETTIVDVATGQVKNVVAWRIDERLGQLGLGGEWLTGDLFLIYETLDEGPLLVVAGGEARPVATELFGLERAPSILDPQGVSLRATGAVPAGEDGFHLALAGVGLEAGFPPVRLYHSETGEVEELPYRYLSWPAFSPDGRWLVLDARPDKNGYQTSELWLRPVDPAGSAPQRLASDVSAPPVWSPDWTQVAVGLRVGLREGVSLLSAPDGTGLGAWTAQDYTLFPLSWSPGGEFLAVSGSRTAGQGGALFIIRSPRPTSGTGSTYTDHVLGLAFDVPAGWQVEGNQGAEGHVFALAGADAGPPVLTFSVVTEGDLETALAEIERGGWGPFIQDVRSERLGGFEALRLELAPGEDRPPVVWLLVAPSGQAVGFIPRSEIALAESLLASLRPVPPREPGEVPPADLAQFPTVQPIDPPIPSTGAGPITPQPGWQTFNSEVFRVSLQYPPGWEAVQEGGDYVSRYAGADGSFQIDAMSGGGRTVDEACELVATHKLQPYGSHPGVGRLQIQGQEACFILPAPDQPDGFEKLATLVVRYPQPVQISGESYAYLLLHVSGNQSYLSDIARTLEFMDSKN